MHNAFFWHFQNVVSLQNQIKLKFVIWLKESLLNNKNFVSPIQS